jgi:1-deoxy-D-xylulose-5-phosphate reductoisomerase
MSPHVRRVAVLGSTGSIGRQALDVIAGSDHEIALVGLAAGTDERSVAAQAQSLGVPYGMGEEFSIELARDEDVDVVLNAIVGAAGLRASIAALNAGKVLALANKESLVSGGEVCMAAAARGGGSIVPVDSEHAAIAQCLRGRDGGAVRRLVLTASGGPFRTRPDLSDVTPRDALAHPTWSMGPKITVDSATLMNKGLEVIEAHHLFDAAYDDIDVVVHPQSIVHGIVEFADGTALMNIAPPDMRIPIAAALGIAGMRFGSVDLARTGRLDFEDVDTARFPAISIAYDAGRRGLTYPAVLNAANEEAVRAFLGDQLGFEQIVRIVAETLEAHEPQEAGDLDAVLEADGWARRQARELIDRPVRATHPARTAR